MHIVFSSVFLFVCCCCCCLGLLLLLFGLGVIILFVCCCCCCYGRCYWWGGGGVAFLVVVVVVVVVVVFKNYLKKSLFSNSLSAVYFVNETKRAHDHCTQTYITLICLACISLSHQC